MWAASCLASCCATCACEACKSVAGGISRRSARIAYCGLFALSLFVAWIFREIAPPLMEKIPWINYFAETPSREWFQTDAVLRVSLGSFLFFAVFALIMIGVKDQRDARDSWHHGGWMAKIMTWCTLVVLMFFVPNGLIGIYETLSKFGSGLFLLIQVVLLLDFTHTWNNAWVSKDEQFWYIALLVVSLVCYIGTFAFSGLLFHWFNPSGYDCNLNTFFIVVTLSLAFVFAVVALHPKVNGSLLPASVISVYCTYLCYSGLSSEPRDYECNGLHGHVKAVSTSTLLLGMITTVLSVVYSAVRAGSSTALLSPPSSPRAGSGKPLLSFDEIEEGHKNTQKDEERPVTYSYSFFHVIFALASMYSAMLLTGWTSSTADGEKLIGVGWHTVWVRICTEWITAALYIWSLVAPLLFPDREFF
uniref:Serine incorporator n=1 Tax=Picea sitchensis TaxID=3332 RepID=B8LQ32_PICSI|nr:unknown [Picea sitchensis]ABR17907.1 unknown [Picea sitchensis]